ncbi:hypothetical protein NKG05_27770 [Oerskovia sp. M15]
MSFASGLAVGAVVVATLVLSVLGGMLVTPWVLRAAARRSRNEGEARPVRDPGRFRRPVGDRPPARRPRWRSRPAHQRRCRLRPHRPRLPHPTRDRSPAVGPRRPLGEEALQTLRGGTWIGILERLAITGCLLAGYPAGSRSWSPSRVSGGTPSCVSTRSPPSVS